MSSCLWSKRSQRLVSRSKPNDGRSASKGGGSAQAHELKTGEAAVVLAEVERLRTLMQQMGRQEAVKTRTANVV